MPRSSRQEASQLLDDAVSELSKDTPSTSSRINTLEPFLNRNDLYVFVIDESTGTFVTHGTNNRLTGREVANLHSPSGDLIGPSILAAIKGRTEAEATYEWRNPVTGTTEPKHTLMKRYRHYIVGVEHYSKPL